MPFYIRAGKCLPVTATEVLVQFRRPPALYSVSSSPPNQIRFRISPDVAIAIETTVKAPGELIAGRPAELLAVHNPDGEEMDAYERLLGNAMKGNSTEFAREDYVEEAWRIVEPVLGNTRPVEEYEPHTWGPSEVDRQVSPPGGWQNPVVAARAGQALSS